MKSPALELQPKNCMAYLRTSNWKKIKANIEETTKMQYIFFSDEHFSKKSVSAPHRTSQFFEKNSPHRTSPHIIIFLPHPHRTRTPPHIIIPLQNMNLEEV